MDSAAATPSKLKRDFPWDPEAKELLEEVRAAGLEPDASVAASAVSRYHIMNQATSGEMMSLDIAFPRNEKDWFETLPPDIDQLFELKLYYGHLFCHVLHHNYIVKKGVDTEELMRKLLKYYDSKGAEYPAEHNVGHEYFAKPALSKFYKELYD